MIFDHNGNLFSGGDPGEQRPQIIQNDGGRNKIIYVNKIQYDQDDEIDPTEVELNMID